MYDILALIKKAVRKCFARNQKYVNHESSRDAQPVRRYATLVESKEGEENRKLVYTHVFPNKSKSVPDQIKNSLASTDP